MCVCVLVVTSAVNSLNTVYRILARRAKFIVRIMQTVKRVLSPNAFVRERGADRRRDRYRGALEVELEGEASAEIERDSTPPPLLLLLLIPPPFGVVAL